MTRRARIAWLVVTITTVLVAGVLLFLRSQMPTINIYIPPDVSAPPSGEPAPAPDVAPVISPRPDMATGNGAPKQSTGQKHGEAPANGAPTLDLPPGPGLSTGGGGGLGTQPGATHAPRPEAPPDIDALLAQMQLGNVAFNTPEQLYLKQTALIQLLLSATTAVEALKLQLNAQGTPTGAQIKISDRMEAKLTGPAFDITAITPETQAVSRSENTEWKWDVVPRSTGTHALHLTLSALVEVNGETTPRMIKTFDRDIVVEVTAAQRVTGFVSENWQWLWAAILVPLATWWWSRRARSAKAKR